MNYITNSQNQTFSTQKYYFHICARTHGDENFSCPIATVWELCIRKMGQAYNSTQVDIIGFVLMNNHYHLIIKANFEMLNEFMCIYKFSFFQNFHYEIIRSNKYLHHAYRYIYQNPIRAKISNRVQDYPYSFISKIKNERSLPFPIIDKFGVLDEYKLFWLNQTLVP